MSLVDDLIENLVERNAIDLDGTFTITALALNSVSCQLNTATGYR